VALLPYLLVLLAIPIGPGEGAVGQVLDAGLFVVLAVMGVGVLGSLMAGWASANKYSLLGGLRTAAPPPPSDLPMLPPAPPPARASSSSPGSPNSSARPSTCRSPTRRSSSVPTPSTPVCASPCSCSPSTPGSSSCAG